MILKALFLSAAAVLSLAGCRNSPTPEMTAGLPGSLNQRDEAAFVAAAASSNLFEIQSSQLALKRSRDRKIRRFAQQMIADHTRALKNMAMVVGEAGLPPPPHQLAPHHQRMLDDLSAASRKDFAEAYVRAQVAAHEESVMLFRDYAERGRNARLARFADDTLPTLQMHRNHIRNIEVTRPPAP